MPVPARRLPTGTIVVDAPAIPIATGPHSSSTIGMSGEAPVQVGSGKAGEARM
ncbi:hypothetical protein AB0M95_12785 [Sphaerisporangium sp. NPDC051017]|uniref:hypothetical protein n=1 Tax=Sphaerisporangium sp. NPDC051017 TaxID=3154636 RepID=UPI003425AD96